MTRIALFWFNLPLLVKLFVVLILFYLYIITCIQLYTVLETNKLNRNELKEREMHRQYGLEIEKFLDEVVNSKYYNIDKALQYKKMIKSNKYFAIMFFKRITSRIRKFTDGTKTDCFIQRKKILDFVYDLEFYNLVIEHEKILGEYNVLSILGILRDKRCLPYFEIRKNKTIKQKSIVLGYYVMLGYARMGQIDLFKPIYDIIINTREISSQEMYVGLLLDFEADIVDWQEDMLLNGNVGHKIIAVRYFTELHDLKYVEYVVKELTKFSEKTVINEKENELKDAFLEYIACFKDSIHDKEMIV